MKTATGICDGELYYTVKIETPEDGRLTWQEFLHGRRLGATSDCEFERAESELREASSSVEEWYGDIMRAIEEYTAIRGLPAFVREWDD